MAVSITLVDQLREYARLDAFRDGATFTAAADEIERRRGFWTGDKLTGGHEVCHTCQAHCVVIGDKDAQIKRLRTALVHIGEQACEGMFTEHGDCPATYACSAIIAELIDLGMTPEGVEPEEPESRV